MQQLIPNIVIDGEVIAWQILNLATFTKNTIGESLKLCFEGGNTIYNIPLSEELTEVTLSHYKNYTSYIIKYCEEVKKKLFGLQFFCSLNVARHKKSNLTLYSKLLIF